MDIFKLLEEHYITAESICGSLMEGIIIAASNSDFLYWNGTARYLMGNKQKDVPTEDWAREYGIFDLKGERYLNREELPLIRALSGEEFQEERFLTKNVNFPNGIVLSVSGKPLRSGEATVGALLTFRDVSQQVNTEQHLQTERTLYKNSFDQMPGYVYIKDLDSRYLFGNKKFRQLLGVESVDGKTTSDFMSNELTETIKEHDRYVLQTKTAKTFEEIVYWKDHTRSVFLTSRFPFRNSNNEIIGICVVANDITKFENLTDQPPSESELQLSKLAITGKLAFEVSQTVIDPLEHVRNLGQEILSDLNSDLCDLELMKRKFIRADQMIQQVQRAAEAIHWLEGLDIGPIKEKATLADVLSIVHSLFRERLRKSEIVWDASGVKEFEREVFFDKINLTEVITNMVILALQASEGSAQKRIILSSEKDVDRMRLALEHSSLGKSLSGITTLEGLSWNICQSIAQKQGWKIEHKNFQGRGSLQLFLPLKIF